MFAIVTIGYLPLVHTVVGHLLLLPDSVLLILRGFYETPGEQIEQETLDNSRNLKTVAHVKALHIALVETVRLS